MCLSFVSSTFFHKKQNDGCPSYPPPPACTAPLLRPGHPRWIFFLDPPLDTSRWGSLHLSRIPCPPPHSKARVSSWRRAPAGPFNFLYPPYSTLPNISSLPGDSWCAPSHSDQAKLGTFLPFPSASTPERSFTSSIAQLPRTQEESPFQDHFSHTFIFFDERPSPPWRDLRPYWVLMARGHSTLRR